jgi:hypothetical protein
MPERGGFRTPFTVKDEQLSRVFKLDVLQDEDIDLPENLLDTEEHWLIGEGRDVALITDQGFDVPEGDIGFMKQTAKLDHKVLGNCVTTGTSYPTPKTDTIASGGGTAVLTLTTGGLTIDAHIGDMVQVTSGDQSGAKLHIVSNTANTITVDIDTPANIDGDSIEIKTGPFLHTMTQGDIQQTIALHYEHQNDDSAQDIIKDYFGCVVIALTNLFEKKGDGMQTPTFKVAKSKDGVHITKPLLDTLEVLKWSDTGNSGGVFDLGYNSTNPMTADDCDSVSIRIVTEVDVDHVVGDEYANRKDEGSREYEIVLHYYPTNRTLRDLRDTKVKDYATPIDFRFKVVVTHNPGASGNPHPLDNEWDQYIDYVFDKLRVKEHDKMIPSKDTKIMDCDVTLRNWAYGEDQGTLQILDQNIYGIGYYEGSTLP